LKLGFRRRNQVSVSIVLIRLWNVLNLGDFLPMRTSAEYLALSERYRIAKLRTQDAATRERFETFERSYFLLAKSAMVLARSKAMQEALERNK
jgi:hypothetical protein